MKQLPFPILVITEEWLVDHGACHEGIEAFVDTFEGTRVALNATNLERIEDRYGDSATWLVNEVELPTPPEGCGNWGCCDSDALTYLMGLEAAGREALSR